MPLKGKNNLLLQSGKSDNYVRDNSKRYIKNLPFGSTLKLFEIFGAPILLSLHIHYTESAAWLQATIEAGGSLGVHPLTKLLK